MRYPFESPEAQLLNIQIFETIYYAALEASCELAEELGAYETYAGSPVSKGVSSFHNVSNPTWGVQLSRFGSGCNCFFLFLCFLDSSVRHVG